MQGMFWSGERCPVVESRSERVPPSRQPTFLALLLWWEGCDGIRSDDADRAWRLNDAAAAVPRDGSEGEFVDRT